MSNNIYDYPIRPPVGATLQSGTASIPRGMPSNTFVYPVGVDSESMIMEIPIHNMYSAAFCVLFSARKNMQDIYAAMGQGALQFTRPLPVADPSRSFEYTSHIHVQSGKYFRHGDMNQPDTKLQLTMLNGGDSSQYSHWPYSRIPNTLQPTGYPVSNLSINSPTGGQQAVVFTFEGPRAGFNGKTPLGPEPRQLPYPQDLPSRQWFDSLQVLIRQMREGSKFLTVNFRFVDQWLEEDRDEHNWQLFYPVLFDVVNCRLEDDITEWTVDDRVVPAIHIVVSVKETNLKKTE